LNLTSKTVFGLVLLLACATVLSAGEKKDKSKPESKKAVDSGSFGVYLKGQRVLTETFSIHEEDGISVVKSRLQEAAGSTQVRQSSELRMTSSGELIRYDWTDGTGSLFLVPNNEFLLEKITPQPAAKAAEQPFLMPSTSAILDNNFFIHREVLAWRYLATNCKTEGGNLQCQEGPVEFGALAPQDRASLRVRMQLAGREKILIRGAERELLRLNLSGEAFSWVLWVDEKDHFKLIRVLIPEADTEVLRD
jgi:hypothetical protein